ncbi:putative adenine nucleotide alpha hydrolase (AANH) superfamily ATPase [Aequitasia blattaphilus]|uniref:Epoxyqueuosine reductase QueH n=1 Tax=Aequitasia blattaphilus TaxID=2949332 RepID=A0ABT1E763_9FIRM|nr:epoxyqueuosine reductase QueH [Aequitasia blattaphilus]MCP1101613.1 epoxyqueuosine reductase QueH [Aequitasia blattaphilus]MCR8614253.1 epoxyqueuosine reductase QueH [Aequitasia blattaphilus]
MNCNYGKVLEDTLNNIKKQNKVPNLLLHSCCAPCSSYVLEYLSGYFNITVLFYNPNIFPEEEFKKREEEERNFIGKLKPQNPITFMGGPYESEKFYQMAQGLEDVREGGVRCEKCFRLRLTFAAETAKKLEMDYFTTTLSISPLKNARLLNEIGKELEKEYEIPYLYSDFKKKDGYKRSIELSREYGLYRQDYCGCEFSKNGRK